MNRYRRRRLKRPRAFTGQYILNDGKVFPAFGSRAWYCHPTKGWRSFKPEAVSDSETVSEFVKLADKAFSQASKYY